MGIAVANQPPLKGHGSARRTRTAAVMQHKQHEIQSLSLPGRTTSHHSQQGSLPWKIISPRSVPLQGGQQLGLIDLTLVSAGQKNWVFFSLGYSIGKGISETSELLGGITAGQRQKQATWMYAASFQECDSLAKWPLRERCRTASPPGPGLVAGMQGIYVGFWHADRESGSNDCRLPHIAVDILTAGQRTGTECRSSFARSMAITGLQGGVKGRPSLDPMGSSSARCTAGCRYLAKPRSWPLQI